MIDYLSIQYSVSFKNDFKNQILCSGPRAHIWSRLADQPMKDVSLYQFWILNRSYDEYLDRLIESDAEEQGIAFSEFRDFGQFLNNLDDFAIAMRMYSLADRPISQGSIFQKSYWENPTFSLLYIWFARPSC